MITKSITKFITKSITRSLTRLALCALLAMPAGLTSCSESFDDVDTMCGVSVIVSMPDNIDAGSLTDCTVKFTNLSSGSVTELAYPVSADAKLLVGLYDVSFEGKGELEGNRSVTIRGVARSVEIRTDGMALRMETYCNMESDDLIISELFYTGTLQSSGNSYTGDDYVKLYNNTDHVVYADGITFFETKFLTTQKLQFDPDIMNEAATVHALYTIPGSGHEHPVQPGEYVLLADVGIDHRSANPNSFSLEHADWEWYDVSSVPAHMDIDSPLVENLDKWYCYTQSFFLLHNRGYKAYGIARIPISKEEYLKDYWYSYNYELVTTSGTFPMSASAYRLPNDWIVDVVNCSVASEWQWNVTTPSLDMGWTSCGEINSDKTRYFHAVRRKLLYVTDDGRAVFRDTNNSTEDFNANVTPSEIELQHTVTSLGGACAEIITYDGVTPKQ